MADISTAKDLLLSLIYPVTEADMTEEQTAQFELAAAEQLDYSASYSGNIRSESVGDVSVSYDVPSAEKAPLRYYGQPVSPAAVGILARCGLMRRWI